MKQNFLTIILVIFLPICAFFVFWFYFLYSSVVTDDKGYVFYLKPGTGIHAFATQLYQQGVISYPSLFTFYGHLQGNIGLKSGEYFFEKGSTAISIWRQVSLGTGLAYHPFAIIPGWTFAQLRHALTQADGLKQLIGPMSDKQIMLNLGVPSQSPEGEFYPETYYYTRGEPDLVILKRAYDLMQSRLHDAWQGRAGNLPYKTPYEILIAASLIEKEAYLSTERPIISGVVVNRLRNNMLLQFDPTVIYGMGKRYQGKIYKSDLLENTAYNTYVHRGLPPTPIAIPSQSSIEAAIHPQQNHYLYFVAKGDGSHQFSQTLAEHNAAVTAIIKQNGFINNININEHLQDLLELYNGIGQVH